MNSMSCPVDEAFDPLSPDYLADPYAILAALPHREQPIFYAPAIGYYVLTRYDDIAAVFRDPASYSAAVAQAPLGPITEQAQKILLGAGHKPQPSMVSLDEPEHARLRKPTARAFSMKRVTAMVPTIEATTARLLDAVDGEAEFDLVAALAFPLPANIVFSLMGVPEQDFAQLKHWCGYRAALGWGRPAPEDQVEIATSMAAYRGYLRDLVDRKATEPGDDLTSDLIVIHREAPDRLTRDEIGSILFSLSFAGHETTTGLIGNTVRPAARAAGPLGRDRAGPGPDPGRGRGDPALRPFGTGLAPRHHPAGEAGSAAPARGGAAVPVAGRRRPGRLGVSRPGRVRPAPPRRRPAPGLRPGPALLSGREPRPARSPDRRDRTGPPLPPAEPGPGSAADLSPQHLIPRPAVPPRPGSLGVSFRSILFEPAHDLPQSARPDSSQVLADLNLDQVCSALTLGRDQYDLAPYFLSPLPDEAAIYYRHQVLRDLRTSDVRAAVAAFARSLTTMRQSLAQVSRLGHRYQQQRWFLDAANTYSQAVLTLAQQLRDVELTSAGLTSWREYLENYLQSAEYQQLTAGLADLLDRLREVRYCVHIKANRVKVTRYEDEKDYGAEVERTFAKFAQGTAAEDRTALRTLAEMDHVEAKILDGVATLFPELFSELDDFRRRYASFADDLVMTFDREVQFYLAYLDYIRPLESAGCEFCYPEVSTASKQTRVDDGFDLALASKLQGEGKVVVRNSLQLDGPERVIVVTGPNQGGKTTFARMFGQLHYLASLGLPVPGRSARLFVPDRIFTHFEKEENLDNLRSNLEDELVRMHDILAAATSRSVIVMNESFASTTLEDASFLGARDPAPGHRAGPARPVRDVRRPAGHPERGLREHGGRDRPGQSGRPDVQDRAQACRRPGLRGRDRR